MSRGLGKVERTILNVCRNLTHPKAIRIHYIGGERSVINGEYKRRVRIGRKEIDLPNDIIDLMEVYSVIKKGTDISQPSYCRALHNLIRKKYLMPMYRKDFQRKRIRFAVLNVMNTHNTK